MNNDHRLGFLAGLAGGVALGLLCARRREAPALRKLHDLKRRATDLTDSATSALSRGKAGVVRQHDAVVNAFDAGIRAYQKTAG